MKEENMKERETIVIDGKSYDVDVNFGMLLDFEEMSGKNIFEEDFSGMKSRLALVLSAMKSGGYRGSDDILTKSKDWRGILGAYTKVMEMVTAFFKVPDIVQREEVDESHVDADEKNLGN